ncbi:MAG: peptidase [Calditrichia bacterium]
MKKVYGVLLFALLLFLVAGCQNQKDQEIKMLEKTINEFAPTEITYNQSILDGRQAMVVQYLYYAATMMDSIFLDQVYSQNYAIQTQLEASHTKLDSLRLVLFNIMFGPFNRLNENEPFIGDDLKPLGANFYPEDMTKQEFQQWLELNPGDEKSFTSEYTMIRRKDDGLVAIPYSVYYKNYLSKASDYLREAAGYADNQSLKTYLLALADAFLSNDYYQSDMDWMDLKDNLIEVVMGPYEVYEDQLFNYKASFEAFITLKDPDESAKLARFAGYLSDIEKNLPIPDEYKNYERGSESPIVVAQEIFDAGDAKAGVQTLAFNLPNDERVRKAKGSKKVLLKNVNEAKFDNILTPIAKIVLADDQLPYLTFDAFFNHVLMHEISHGVGPGFITVNGRKTEVKKELKETYSTIEECKADVLGMYNNILMIQKGEFPPSFDRETYVTFLAGIFRSVRFGINEAHGAGNAIIYNYLLEQGAYQYDETTQKVSVNFDVVYNAIKDLAHKLLMIQAQGNYQGAKDLIAKYAVMPPSIKTLTGKLGNVPVDIRPIFEIEQIMSAK